jgi:acetyl-CoA synthetase
MSEDSISNLLSENRTFPPSEEFSIDANLQENAYEEAARDRIGFWERQAERLDWFERWHTALKWAPPFAEWFMGGKINASYNCLDRHVIAGKGSRTALIFEGEPGHQDTHLL